MRLMKKLFLGLFLIIISSFSFYKPSSIRAATGCQPDISVDKSNNFNTILTFSEDVNKDKTFQFSYEIPNSGGDVRDPGYKGNKVVTQTATAQGTVLTFNLGKLVPGNYTGGLGVDLNNNGYFNRMCDAIPFFVPDVGQGGTISKTTGSITFDPSNPQPTDTVAVRVTNLPKDGIYFMSVGQPGIPSSFSYQCSFSSGDSIVYQIGPLHNGQWTVSVGENKDQQSTDQSKCVLGDSGIIASGIVTVNYIYPTPTPDAFLPILCGDTCSTAIGNIITHPEAFVGNLFAILLSLSGGVALILIIISGYRLMTSQGNPEKVQQAREQLTSAIIGLLFIIFSLAILQIIGVDILRIPGLNSK